MNYVIKMKEFADFTLTRDAGNRIYEKIKQFITDQNENVDALTIDFENINDVSVSFIQATVLRLANEYSKIELQNINDAIRFKINTLLKITTIDPAVLNKVKNFQLRTF